MSLVGPLETPDILTVWRQQKPFIRLVRYLVLAWILVTCTGVWLDLSRSSGYQFNQWFGLFTLPINGALFCLGVVGAVRAFKGSMHFHLPYVLLHSPLAQLGSWMTEPRWGAAIMIVWWIILLAAVLVPPGTYARALWAGWLYVRESTEQGTISVSAHGYSIGDKGTGVR